MLNRCLKLLFVSAIAAAAPVFIGTQVQCTASPCSKKCERQEVNAPCIPLETHTSLALNSAVARPAS